MRRVIRNALVIVGLTLLLLEAVLQLVDPFGQIYSDDLHSFYRTTEPHKTGYTWQDGVYRLSHWSYTIKDGRRIVPSADEDGRTVYIIGDSVSFGWGVADDETFVNVLADLLNLNAILLSKPAYNRENIYLLSEEIPTGACVLYMVVHNDDKAPRFHTPATARPLLRTLSLLHYIPAFIERQTPKPFGDYMNSLVDEIGTDKRLFVVNFEAEFVRGGLVVNSPERISFLDRHLNAQGNREIAEQISADGGFKTWLKTCH